MKVKSFDPETSREMVGDTRARTIEEKARKDADNGVWSPPEPSGFVTYWGQAQDAFATSVYTSQWNKRKARNDRKAAV